MLPPADPPSQPKHGTLHLLCAHPAGSYAEPWQLHGSPPSAIPAAEDAAPAEPSTGGSQLGELHHPDTYSGHGKARLAASPTHTGTRTTHTFGRAGVCHTAWPCHTPRVPSHTSPLSNPSCAFCVLPPFSSKSDLGSGGQECGKLGMCSRGHGCSSTGRCEQATKVWAQLCSQPGLLLGGLQTRPADHARPCNTSKWFFLAEGVPFPTVRRRAVSDPQHFWHKSAALGSCSSCSGLGLPVAPVPLLCLR